MVVFANRLDITYIRQIQLSNELMKRWFTCELQECKSRIMFRTMIALECDFVPPRTRVYMCS